MSLTEARRQALQAQLKAAIDDADEQAGVALAQATLAEGITPVVLFQDVIQPVLQEIGDAFARLDVFLPELMRAGLVVKAMQQEVLEPAIRQSGGESGSAGTVVIGTAQGDIHDIGKNMVALMLAGQRVQGRRSGHQRQPADLHRRRAASAPISSPCPRS